MKKIVRLACAVPSTFGETLKNTVVQTRLHISDISRRVLALSVLFCTVVVIGCAGGSQNSSSLPVAPTTFTIGGTISGLSGSGLVLQDSGGNNLTVSAGATSFTFSTAMASGSAYSVTVLTQPSNPAQYCGVKSGGSGTVADANVLSVAISCTNTYTIGGTISGLTGAGLVLQANNANYLSVSAGANSFTFTTPFISGVGYAVTIFAQPHNPPQTCTVTDGSVFVSSANITSVVVSCLDSIGFDLTGSMTHSRAGHTATLLNNGQVLIAGGSVDESGDNTASAELYDPATGTFTATGSMTTTRGGHTATLLFNGQVLIAGGSVDDGGDNTASAELYDLATGTFTATGSMTIPRSGHTATSLFNGKVLIAGGEAGSLSTESAELYDPATKTFTATGNMTTARFGDTATLLNTGQVLIAGGTFGTVSAELYDPATASFTSTGNMTTARAYHTATLLNTGKVLMAGGGGGGIDGAELYNPATGTFTSTGYMNTDRFGQTATLLNNGQVLIAGGVDDDNNDKLSSAELYDPATGTFTATGSMSTARDGQTATLLNSGNVLVAGGFASSSPLASAELYLPATTTPPGLVSITVTPATPTLSAGSTQKFVATGTFSDGSMQILQSVTWSSSNQAACTITNDASDHGLALALAAGKSTITASAGSISGSAVLTVQ